jgi:hypothetical protein
LHSGQLVTSRYRQPFNTSHFCLDLDDTGELVSTHTAHAPNFFLYSFSEQAVNTSHFCLLVSIETMMKNYLDKLLYNGMDIGEHR